MGYVIEEEVAPTTLSAPKYVIEETPTYTGPKLFEDPIGALTSADWWLTRPSGGKLSIGQAIAGPAVKTLDALTLGAGDEISAFGSSLLTGNGYEDTLSQARGAQQSFEQASPLLSGALTLAGALKTPIPGMGMFSPAKGIIPAATNIAKGGALGAGIGAGSGFLSGEGAERLDTALTGAKWGAGVGAAGQSLSELLQGGASYLGSKAKDVEDALVGFNPDKIKQKIGGFTDKTGAKVSKPIDGGSQVGALEQKVDDLRAGGFFERIKSSDTAKSVSNKLSIFKDEAGTKLSNVIDDAAKAESDMFTKIAPQQKAFYQQQVGAPQFKEAAAYVDQIANVSPTKAAPLQKALQEIRSAWERSDKSLKALKSLKEDFGQINKKAFGPTLSDADLLTRTLNNKIYGSLAESLSTRVEGLGKWISKPKLIDQFRAANKAYSAASELEPRAFNASKKFGVKQAARDLWSLKTVASAALGVTGSPILGGILGAERAATALADIAPVQASKLLKSSSKLADKAGKGIKSGIIANIVGQESGETSPNIQPKNLLATQAPQKTMTTRGKEIEAALAASLAPKVKVADKPDVEVSGLVDESHPLIKAVIKAESNGNPKAVGRNTKYGRAKGSMQLLDTTARATMKEMGLNPKEWNPFDEKLNVKVGTHYLNKMIKKYDGNVIKALMAYNWGEGNVAKYERGVYKSIPSETRNYINKILGEKIFL